MVDNGDHLSLNLLVSKIYQFGVIITDTHLVYGTTISIYLTRFCADLIFCTIFCILLFVTNGSKTHETTTTFLLE